MHPQAAWHANPDDAASANNNFDMCTVQKRGTGEDG